MELRDLLELLYTSNHRFSNIQVRWNYWYRHDLMHEAEQKWAAQYPSGSVGLLTSQSVRSNLNENELNVNWKVWWQKPSCWRDEQQIAGHGTTIRVICENRWWSFSSAGNQLYTNMLPGNELPSDRVGFISVEAASQDVPLLDPSFLLATHDLQVIGDAVHTGRATVQVRAVSRKGKEVSRDAFFWGAAEEYDLLVDKEQGILLRYAAKLKEQEFAIASVEEVSFDEPIPEEVFFFSPPATASIEVIS